MRNCLQQQCIYFYRCHFLHNSTNYLFKTFFRFCTHVELKENLKIESLLISTEQYDLNSLKLNNNCAGQM